MVIFLLVVKWHKDDSNCTENKNWENRTKKIIISTLRKQNQKEAGLIFHWKYEPLWQLCALIFTLYDDAEMMALCWEKAARLAFSNAQFFSSFWPHCTCKGFFFLHLYGLSCCNIAPCYKIWSDDWKKKREREIENFDQIYHSRCHVPLKTHTESQVF